jgi:hypothetical protein
MGRSTGNCSGLCQGPGAAAGAQHVGPEVSRPPVVEFELACHRRVQLVQQDWRAGPKSCRRCGVSSLRREGVSKAVVGYVVRCRAESHMAAGAVCVDACRRY